VDGATETLAPDELDVRLTAREGFAAGNERGLVVVLDTQLTSALLHKGLARELQSRLQGLRKERDLPFAARVEVWLGEVGGDLAAALDEHRDAVAREVQADRLEAGSAPGGVEAVALRVAEHDLTVGMRVVES